MYLHDAIAEVLKAKPGKTATIEDIAAEINKRNLYSKKDGSPLKPEQVMLRAKLAGGKYHHMFEYIEPDRVRLKL